jgi:uncharacterized membrane protein YphA (DoxX/SURF4 family)
MTATSVSAIEPPRMASRWRIPLLVGRLLLGGIFVYAAYTKLHFDGRWHLQDYHFFFAMAIDSYHLLPLALVQWMARVLPWVELVLGSLLILGIAARWVSATIGVLLLVFMAAMARAKMLGLEINCGCFGNRSENIRTELMLDSGLLLLAIAVTMGGFLVRRARRSPA